VSPSQNYRRAGWGLAALAAAIVFGAPAAAQMQISPSQQAAPKRQPSTGEKSSASDRGAQAQPSRNQGPPNALQGFSQNRDQPVKIQAATLEVRDKDKVATFSGNVEVKQGDTTLLASSLNVHYEDEPGSAPSPTAGVPNGQQRIKLIEAKGGVKIIQKDQAATGDTGLFNMRDNVVTLSGNVVLTRGQDVLRGQRLVVDLNNGVSRIESGRENSGRVEGMFRAGNGQGMPDGIGRGFGQPPQPRGN